MEGEIPEKRSLMISTHLKAKPRHRLCVRKSTMRGAQRMLWWEEKTGQAQTGALGSLGPCQEAAAELGNGG